MKREAARALRRVAAKTGQGQHAAKRQWLKLSHKERAIYRPRLLKAAQ